MSANDAKRSSPAALGLVWAIVVLPTLWGLTYTVENALKLFRNSPPPVTICATADGEPMIGSSFEA